MFSAWFNSPDVVVNKSVSLDTYDWSSDLEDFATTPFPKPLSWLFEQSNEVSITREIDNCLIKLQKMGIRINKVDRIREYLLRFPDVIGATLKIAEVAVAYLPEARFTLEVYQDPEIEDDHLVFYVRFRNYEDFVMDRIREFRRECRGYIVGKTGWLHITTDFRSAE